MVQLLLCYDSEGESFLSFKNDKFSHPESSDKMSQSLNLYFLHEGDYKEGSAFSVAHKGKGKRMAIIKDMQGRYLD